MNPDDQRLAQGLSLSAEDLEYRGWTRSGLLRQGARRIVELAVEIDQLRTALGVPTSGDSCRKCHGPIVQAGRGRPRIYCGDCSPRKKAG